MACRLRRRPAPSPSPSGSVSELLEEGIFNEETKGDIDAAIAIYQQVLARTAADQSVAAQAEFHLAQCYLKKDRKDDATAAFQKLVDNYPNQTALVAKAKQYLPGEPALEPAPWVDGERMQMKLYLANGMEAGVMEYRSDLVQSGTTAIWRVGGFLSAGTVSAVSSVDAEMESFHPIASRWKYSMLGEVHAVYHPGEVELRYEGRDGVTTVKLDGDVIDNEQANDEIRRLPLKEGYKTTLPIFSTLGGASIPVRLEVTGTETVESPMGKFDCYKVQLSMGETFWYSADAHRYLVKCEVGPLTGKLTSVTQRKVDEPVTFHDDELGVSLTAPPYWVVCRYKGQPPGQALIRTYDADVDAEDGGVRYFATDMLSPGERTSSKAWAESELKNDIMKLSDDVKVRPDGWKDYTVEGLPGVSFIADYTKNGTKKTLFSLYVIGPKNSEHFVIITPPEKFDALMKEFDTIIASYRRT